MVLRAVLSEFKRTGVEETKFGDVSIDVIEMILLCKKEKENKVEREWKCERWEQRNREKTA